MLLDLYDKLLIQQSPVGDAYKIIALPNMPNHKIGIDSSSFVSVLIYNKGKTEQYIPTRRFKYFEMFFNRKCKIVSDEEQPILIEKYTVLTFKNINRELQSYFLTLCEDLLKRLGNNPNTNSLVDEIYKITSLFQLLSSPPTKTIQGLFGELLIINHSNFPNYHLKAWHVDQKSIYDFDDGKECLEVKTTTSPKRIHSFSQEQLANRKGRTIYVASVLLQRIDMGHSIFELLSEVKERIKDKKLLYKLDTLVFKTLGNELENYDEVRFNYNTAIDSLEYYSVEHIPKILQSDIPTGVTQIKYLSSLEDVPTIDKTVSKLLVFVQK